MSDWIAIGALAVVGIGIPLGMMGVSALLRPSVPEQGKRTIYESGEVPTGSAHIRFNIQYYMVALLFLVFDIETVLLFPWVVIYRPALNAGVPMARLLLPMLAFVGILTVGLVWAWRNGAVEWMSSPRAMRRKTERNQP
ncbi:NADH-quinone oxidoreductase subunit A [Halopenitus persicus]|uniref:NADH dehydrogenase subunit A n=1 Tax=Halopenitus persicus TaxID=1048396 RepID=A0A1H3J7F0_9EURY|nr:NADH-quinone oxidoreductase subunit A [Halopenitus persicus]QHS17386.1 NADH-quinone oxidoreductase subunit A [haloarchaeon 3A1-DGR]SDY35114.1 NADH dehydrogenase subunit A [Halopenitus persicus]